MFGWLGTVIGILLVLIAIFMIFFFPSTLEHQAEFGWRGVLLGLILLIIGGLLIFL